jgi:uncharacterized protein
VHFFGGEPLLYFDTIKSIINDLQDVRDKVIYSMITNGSLINDEVISYCKKHDIHIGVSWDGCTTEKSRLVDVFKTNKDNIFKLDGFSISGVINKYNSVRSFLNDVKNLSEEYNKVNNSDKYIPYNLDNLYNFLNLKDDIYDIDLDIIRNEMKELSYNFIYDKEKNSPIENDYIGRFIEELESYSEIKDTHYYSMCMNGINVLNLDLNGNLYLCHNDSSTLLSTIYDDLEVYEKSYRKLNKTHIYYDEECKDCSVRFICRGGCMLCTGENRSEYCKQRRAFFEPIIEQLLNLV